MMFRLPLTVLVCLVFATGNVTFAEEITADERTSLETDLAGWLKLFNAHDSKRLANEYTLDTELISETGERTKGRAAIEKLFTELFAKNPDIHNEITGVTRRKIAPNIVIEEGTFRASGMKDGPSMEGRYCATLVRHGENWLVRHEQDFVPVADPAKAKAEVHKANQEYEAIILSNDPEGYKRILSDDYVFIDTDASVKNKADVVKVTGTMKFEVAKSEDVVTRFYGNTAILTGIWIEKGTQNNEPFDKKSQFTTVFAKRDGSWKVVSDQLTEMKKK